MERWHPRTGTRRYKTPPATPASRPNRYKTLPTRRKTPISDHLARAERKLSRPGSKQPKQGELFTANHHSPTAQGTHTGTKLPQQPPPQGQTGTKLSQHGEKRPFPTIWREQRENYHGQEANNPSRENFLPQTTTHQPHRAHTPVQNSPSKPPHRRTHKRRGPGRLTVCPAPGPSSNVVAQSLTA